MNITRGNVRYYKDKYKCKVGDIVKVAVEDLAKGSHELVKVLCDYCLENGIENIIEKEYRSYIKGRVIIEKDCCYDCQGKKEIDVNQKRHGVNSTAQLSEVIEKQKMTNLVKYGCEWTLQNQEVREKGKKTCIDKYGVETYVQTAEYQERRKHTCLEKYGTEHPTQSEVVRQKTINTNMEKYGVPAPAQCKNVLEKMEQTNLKRYGFKYVVLNQDIKNKMKETTIRNYGVEHNSQSDIIKQKKINTSLKNYGTEYYMQTEEGKERRRMTNLEKYGVTNLMKIPEFAEKVLVKVLRAMYINGTQTSSKQQKYLCNLLNGELNYPVHNCSLDIAFPDNKIYIEYDGSGHRLSIKFNQITEDDFNTRERNRYYFLKGKGWKLIRLSSRKDLLPNDDEIILLINKAKEYLLNNHSWYYIDIDNNLIKCKEYENEYQFNQLRYIK